MKVATEAVRAVEWTDEHAMTLAKAAALVGGAAALVLEYLTPIGPPVPVAVGLAGVGLAVVLWRRAVVGTCLRCGHEHRDYPRFCSACGEPDPLNVREEREEIRPAVREFNRRHREVSHEPE